MESQRTRTLGHRMLQEFVRQADSYDDQDGERALGTDWLHGLWKVQRDLMI